MRLKITIVTIMFAASLLSGQEKADPPEAVLIPVKTLSGDSFNRLAKLLSVFKARFTFDDKLRIILVYAPKDVVAQIRRVVEQLDQPGSEAAIGRNIEITLAFLRCSTKAQPDGLPLPPDLEAAAKQLRAATQYKTIQLWDVVPLHLQEGKETTHTFRLPGSAAIPNAMSTAFLRIRPEVVSRRDSGRYVRFDPIDIGFKMPYASGSFQSGNAQTQFSYSEVGLKTAGDFKEGQKTVLGKVSGLDDETAVFVVISLKVLD